MVVEFTCADCGYRIHSFRPTSSDTPDLCLTCQWIVRHVPEAERETYRALLNGERAADAGPR